MPLTLRPTGLASPAYRDWADYIVLEDGRAVGRIYEDRHTLPNLRGCPSRCTSIPSRASLQAGAPRAWMRLKRNFYRTGRGAAPTQLHPRSALPRLPPCRCVRVACRRGSSRGAPNIRLPLEVIELR